MTTFSTWLEQTRKASGLTQEELARRAGCTRAYISLLERAVVETSSNEPVKPSLKIVDALARSLGVPAQIPRRLAGYHSPDAESLDQIESRLLAYFRELSPDRQSIIVGIAQLLHDQFAESPLEENMPVDFLIQISDG